MCKFCSRFRPRFKFDFEVAFRSGYIHRVCKLFMSNLKSKSKINMILRCFL